MGQTVNTAKILKCGVFVKFSRRRKYREIGIIIATAAVTAVTIHLHEIQIYTLSGDVNVYLSCHTGRHRTVSEI